MKLIPILMAGIMLGLSAPSARADGFSKLGGYELQLGGSLGGAVVEWIDPTPGSTTRTAALNVVARVRTRRTPFAFEQTLVLPHGMMSALLLDVWRGDRWRAHLDAGAFFALGDRYMSTTEVKRSWDLVLGLGAEVSVSRHLVLTADWRVFVPDPTSIPQQYGDYVRPILKEDERGAQLWLGCDWLF